MGNTLQKSLDSGLAFRQMQQIVQDMPVIYKGIYKQMENLRKLTEKQTELLTTNIKRQEEITHKNNTWLINTHDRLDALLVEMRVANVLLSELLETQRVIIKEDVSELANQTRSVIYDQIRNGG